VVLVSSGTTSAQGPVGLRARQEAPPPAVLLLRNSVLGLVLALTLAALTPVDPAGDIPRP
jgi:hypothetical protein